ncbi:MAG: hypothetical protein V4736_13875, partial [Bdellovibrionota bacterium]
MNFFNSTIGAIAFVALVFTSNASAQETAFETMSPEEIAAEIGLPASSTASDFTLQEATVDNRGVDVTKYWPLVVVVNKAAVGLTAQTVRVYVNGIL